MTRALYAVIVLSLVSACAAKPSTVPPPVKAPPASTVHVVLPVPVCPAPSDSGAKARPPGGKNAAGWKAYALKLEQLLGIRADGGPP